MIDLAIRMAAKSTSRFRLGAVIARRNKVISTGFNQMSKTHPAMERYNTNKYLLGLHAEIHACLGVPANLLYGADIHVARILKDGSVAIAKPCSVCYNYLKAVGIRNIHYTR